VGAVDSSMLNEGQRGRWKGGKGEVRSVLSHFLAPSRFVTTQPRSHPFLSNHTLSTIKQFTQYHNLHELIP
jgi:hypothetical protein